MEQVLVPQGGELLSYKFQICYTEILLSLLLNVMSAPKIRRQESDLGRNTVRAISPWDTMME